MNRIQKQVAALIYGVGVPVSIYWIAKRLEISYPTAKKYVRMLFKEGALVQSPDNRYTFNHQQFKVSPKPPKQIYEKETMINYDGRQVRVSVPLDMVMEAGIRKGDAFRFKLVPQARGKFTVVGELVRCGR